MEVKKSERYFCPICRFENSEIRFLTFGKAEMFCEIHPDYKRDIADEMIGKETGITGSPGPKGDVGPRGPKGDPGPQGEGSYCEESFINRRRIIAFGKDFVRWFGDTSTVQNTYDLLMPTLKEQDNAVMLQGLSLSPDLLQSLYVRFFISDRSKLSKITVKASNGVYSDFNRYVVADGWNEIHLDMTKGTPSSGSNITTIQFQVRGLNQGESPEVVLSHIGIVDKKNSATVSFHFDDAMVSVYTEAKKIFRDFNLVGDIGVIETFVGKPGHMTMFQLEEMKMMGWTLFNHTKSHINMSQYNEQQAREEVLSAKTYLENTYKCREEASYVAYPQGGLNKDVKIALKKEGMIGRALLQREDLLPSIDKQETAAIEITQSSTFATIKPFIDLSIKHGTHITLLFHKIEVPTTSNISTTPEVLRAIVQYIKQNETEGLIRVVNTRELYKMEKDLQ